MRNSVKAVAVAAIIAAPILSASPAEAGRTWAGEKTDPCPGQHVQVYTANNNSVSPHYVCGQVGQDGKDGVDGKDGAPGKDGVDGKDSTVPGPAGPMGPAGESVVGPVGPAGPIGPAGSDGSDGAVGPQGPKGDPGQNVSEAGVDGPQGAAGKDGAVGPAGKNGKDGVTKTIYITRQADGTDEVVDGLPATGGDSDTWWIALAALGLIGAGTAATIIYRKRP